MKTLLSLHMLLLLMLMLASLVKTRLTSSLVLTKIAYFLYGSFAFVLPG